MTQITETINMIPDRILMHIIRHSNDFTWNFLALKIILTRLNLKIVMHHGDESIFPECCAELRNLLKKSTHIPSSRIDLKQILSLEVK